MIQRAEGSMLNAGFKLARLSFSSSTFRKICQSDVIASQNGYATTVTDLFEWLQRGSHDVREVKECGCR